MMTFSLCLASRPVLAATTVALAGGQGSQHAGRSVRGDRHRTRSGQGRRTEDRQPTPEDSENAWSQFVEGAEQAISREHTLWLARGGARFPLAAH